MMNEKSMSLAKREAKLAAEGLRKHFKTAKRLGMDPDEFWYWLGKAIEPRRELRPRCVSAIAERQRRSAEHARWVRQNQNSPRNQEIQAMFETSRQQGEPKKSIYRRMQERFELTERQLRDICEPVRRATNDGGPA